MDEIFKNNSKPDCFYKNDLDENRISYLDIIPANKKFWETLRTGHQSMYTIYENINGFFSSNSGEERGFSQYARVSKN